MRRQKQEAGAGRAFSPPYLIYTKPRSPRSLSLSLYIETFPRLSLSLGRSSISLRKILGRKKEERRRNGGHWIRREEGRAAFAFLCVAAQCGREAGHFFDDVVTTVGLCSTLVGREYERSYINAPLSNVCVCYIYWPPYTRWLLVRSAILRVQWLLAAAISQAASSEEVLFHYLRLSNQVVLRGHVY